MRNAREDKHGRSHSGWKIPSRDTMNCFDPMMPNGEPSVPPWAQHRRQEIVQRISEEWKPIDVHLPAERV